MGIHNKYVTQKDLQIQKLLINIQIYSQQKDCQDLYFYHIFCLKRVLRD